MRLPFALAAALVLSVTGCYDPRPPLTPDTEPEGAILQLPPSDGASSSDETPRVVRRLVREARAQVEKNRLMAAELADARGRERASLEANQIEAELDVLTRRIDDANSDNLDDVMSKLHLLDTRIDLLHERLRAATLRTTAVSKD